MFELLTKSFVTDHLDRKIRFRGEVIIGWIITSKLKRLQPILFPLPLDLEPDYEGFYLFLFPPLSLFPFSLFLCFIISHYDALNVVLTAKWPKCSTKAEVERR